MRKARSVIGSSSQNVAYQEAKPVVFALRGIDQHPVFAVGDEPEPTARGVEQFHHPGGR